MADDIIKMVDQKEFAKKIKPKQVLDGSELFLFQCPDCGGFHFRHAGYVEVLMPFVRADKTAEVSKDSFEVNVCVKCRRSFIWYNEQMYEITNIIDIKAWAKAEKELNEATGPGGEC